MRSLALTVLAMVLALAVVDPAAAQTAADASTQNIYTRADPVAKFPIEATAVFFLALILASTVEFFIDFLGDIESEYFQVIFSSIKQEMLVCSLLTMLIIFAKSLGAFSAKWSLMLNYAVLTLFFMILFMIVIVVSVVISLTVEMNRWKYFEGTRIDADPQLTDKEELFRTCRERFRESLRAKGMTPRDGLMFSDYLLRVERHTMKAVTDLGWRCWTGLAVLILMNGVRSRITAPNDVNAQLRQSDYTINLVSYIVMVGFGTLAFFLILHFVVQSRLRAFVSEPAAKLAPNGTKWIVVTASEFLFFGSMDTTAQLFQTVIVVLEFYFSVFVLAMIYDAFRIFGGAGIVFVIVAVVPLVVFVLMFPWTITMITMLQFLGDGLDVTEAHDLLDALEEQERRNNTLTLAENEGLGEKKVEIKASLGINDEWTGAPVSLHENSTQAATLDTSAPTVEVKTFAHPNAVEMSQTRRAFAAIEKAKTLTDNVGVGAFTSATPATVSTKARLADVWGMLSMPPPAEKSRASGWVDMKVTAAARPSALDSLRQPLVDARDEDVL
jgi:hypothetical protein